ncbi:multidrug and toxin extrusion protein 1 isoform X2 [Microcaecilia unicolor]|uniref:Multidrug and toxin extrusion protein n=1 Tax=Microcaecilia unicolor TaxID=1415580 RepID=A0A6P7ZMM1_9AMPH|nr:multidrug and toxin extrusion protein 1-like isoform X2 [Microcaecilia unicolor]
MHPGLLSNCVQKLWESRVAPLWDDVKETLSFMGSLILIQTFDFLPTVINTIICGHLGKLELDSFAMATIILRTCGIFVGSGLSLACDTLVSQSYGRRNLKEVGLLLQRGILILLLFCFPCWAIFINTKFILLIFGQDPELARQTDVLVMILVPAVPALFMNQLLGKYLRNQNIVLPQIVSGFAANILNATLSAVCVYVLKLGTVAVMWTSVITAYSWLILVVLFILWKKLLADTWGGWSRECLQEWGVFVHFAFYGMLMMCLKWWTFEIGTFLTGQLGLVELGAQAVMYQFYFLAFLVPSVLGITVNVHVGIALGARNLTKAKRSACIAFSFTGFFALLISILTMALKNVLGALFTNETKIVTLVSTLLPVLTAAVLFDAYTFMFAGILRATGKQLLGAIINCVGYCIIGLSLEIVLMFPAKLGALGLWLGILVSVVFQFLWFLVVIVRLDWDKAVEEAQVRAGLNPKGQNLNLDPNAREKSSYTDHPLGDITDPEQAASAAETSASGRVVLTKDLLVRRGAALSAAIAILAAAILIRIFVSKD